MVAINGFGRIGRAVFRILESRPDIDVVAINDLFDPNALRYLFELRHRHGTLWRRRRSRRRRLVHAKHSRQAVGRALAGIAPVG